MSAREWTASDEARFWAMVVVVENCWEWLGATTFGYGVFTFRSKNVRAHRAMWEKENGPVPPGLVLDHLCNNRRCVNPSHLVPTTQRENVLRSQASPSAQNARKTHCHRGHELSGRGILPRHRADGSVSRECRQCSVERNRTWRAAVDAAGALGRETT